MGGANCLNNINESYTSQTREEFDKRRKIILMVLSVCVVLILAITLVFYPYFKYMNAAKEALNTLVKDGNVKNSIITKQLPCPINKYKIKGYSIRDYNEIIKYVIFDIELDITDESKIDNMYECVVMSLKNSFDKNNLTINIMNKQKFADCNISLLSSGEIKKAEAYERINYHMKEEIRVNITDDEKGFAWTVAEREVKGRLKAPSSAKFPTYNHATITKSGDNFVVLGYVDADNSFGAKLRTNFTVEFEKTGSDTYKVIRVNLEE